MKELHYRLRRLAACIVGAVLFIAGTFKLMDPVGSGLIVKEYFNFFHLQFLSPLAYITGVLLALLETIVGIALVSGVWRKTVARIALALMAIFTSITLILWIFNPPMDCGCFGEAVHLTHFQSFLKNVILLALCLFAFFPSATIGTPRKVKYVSFAVVSGSSLIFLLYSMTNIPLMDFTPFNLSSKLEASVDRQAAEDKYVSTFIYEKNGQKGVFTIDAFPDSTWKYVSTETIERQDNIEETDYPSLMFTDASGNYVDSLAAHGTVFVFSMYRPEKLKSEKWVNVSERIADFDSIPDNRTELLVLAAASPADFERMVRSCEGLDEVQAERILRHTYYSDYKTLISLNRSNGGLQCFSDGNLLKKWHADKLPKSWETNYYSKNNNYEIALSSSTKHRLTFQAYLLYTCAVLLLL